MFTNGQSSGNFTVLFVNVMWYVVGERWPREDRRLHSARFIGLQFSILSECIDKSDRHLKYSCSAFLFNRD